MKPALAIVGAMLLAACTQPGPASSTPALPGPASPAAGAITEFPIPTANSRPGGIASGPDGNLWFVELGANKLAKLTTSGSILEFPLPPGTQPGSIAAGPDGSTWITGGDNRVTRVATSGRVIQYTPPSYCAGAITASPDGNLWITEPCSAGSDVGAKVAKLTPSGAFTEYVVPRSGDVPADPGGIAAGPDGNIWFTEESARKVVELTPSGRFTEYMVPPGYDGPESITRDRTATCGSSSTAV
jgi:streptogramin lyase